MSEIKQIVCCKVNFRKKEKIINNKTIVDYFLFKKN